MLKRLFALAAIALLAAAPAHAVWRKATSEHFVIYGEGDARELTALAEKLEKLDYLLRFISQTAQTDQAPRLRIYLLKSDKAVQDLLGNPLAGGFYTTTASHAFAVVSGDSKSSDYDLGPEEILFHEYAHHFMLRYFPSAYPAWYVEGFAEFFSSVRFPRNGNIEFGHAPMSRLPDLQLRQTFPIRQLVSATTDGLGRRNGSSYYATAWLLTHYLLYNPERSKEFAAYRADLFSGKRDLDFGSYFKGGTDALDKEVRVYISRSTIPATALTPSQMPQPSITVEGLEKAAGDLIGLELQAMTGIPDSRLAAFTAQLRAFVAKHPTLGPAHALLAETDRLAERPAEALAAADRAIALSPGLAQAHSTRAQILLEQAKDSNADADWNAALSAIVAANKADTDDPQPLALYYRYYSRRGEQMPDLAHEGLAAAFERLPQRPDYRLMYANDLAFRGQLRRAADLLEPLAFSPHESDLQAQAYRRREELLLEASGKATSEPPG